MTSLNVSLPDDVRALAEHQVASGKFPSVSEYVAALIRQDQERAEREQVEGKLLDRLHGGPSKDVTDTDFEGIRGRVEAEIARRRGP